MKIRALLVAVMLAATLVVAATPAAAQTNQRGLINVAVTDTLVQVPVGVAANLCGVAANVLTQATNVSDIDCRAEGVAIAENGGNGGGAVNQRGLVNVAITGTTLQVPIAVAANICGVAVNILAQATNLSGVDCKAGVESVARA